MGAAVRNIVLLAEDDPMIRALLSDVLTDDGYDVVEAQDGQEAVDIIDQQQTARDRLRLVLLDMMLPKVDGMFVLRRLALANFNVPIIAISGSAAHLKAAAKAGVATTIAKPFDMIELLDAVHRYCGAEG